MMDHDCLQNIANEMRMMVIESIYSAQSGHAGGSLSICDILSVLYFKKMNINIRNPKDENRDRFVLSKGHAAPAYYAALALKGFIPKEDIIKLRKIESYLQGHPCMNKINGVDMSTGSLGQGLSAANGMAIAGKYDHKDYYVYCVCGDGEMQEGQIWEALMTSAHYSLDNLILLIDVNGLQIDGCTEEVMSTHSLKEKMTAFGWSVAEINGHNIQEIDEAVDHAKSLKGKPSVILCNTVKGKGISFMENQVAWHGAAINLNQYQTAIGELKGEI